MVELTKEFKVFSSGRRSSCGSGYVSLRNRSLLLSEKFKPRTLKKWLRIQYGSLPFNSFNIQYTYDTKLQFERLENWRLVSSDFHFDTNSKIQVSSIGICNYICDNILKIQMLHSCFEFLLRLANACNYQI